MSPTTVKPWMTKVIAVAFLVIGYVLHKGIIPPGYEIHVGPANVSLAGVLTDVLVALASLGVSGPQLWAAAAKFLGNPPAPPPTPSP